MFFNREFAVIAKHRVICLTSRDNWWLKLVVYLFILFGQSAFLDRNSFQRILSKTKSINNWTYNSVYVMRI